MKKDICPLEAEMPIAEERPRQCTKFQNDAIAPCMHYKEGRCIWVDSGDPVEFASSRDITHSRFSRIAKAGEYNIRLIIIVDAYFEHVKSNMVTNANTLKEEALELDFPFNYPEHRWTQSIVNAAISEKSYRKFLGDNREFYESELLLELLTNLATELNQNEQN